MGKQCWVDGSIFIFPAAHPYLDYSAVHLDPKKDKLKKEKTGEVGVIFCVDPIGLQISLNPYPKRPWITPSHSQGLPFMACESDSLASACLKLSVRQTNCFVVEIWQWCWPYACRRQSYLLHIRYWNFAHIVWCLIIKIRKLENYTVTLGYSRGAFQIALLVLCSSTPGERLNAHCKF